LLNKKQTLNNMKQTRTQWAVVAFLLVVSTALSAQNYSTPIPKEWMSRIAHLFMLAKKTPVHSSFTAVNCAFSNEITITVAPCADAAKKAELVEVKPVQ
jgi:hypothetical protein